MDANRFSISCCQRCRHFTLEGRRGGHCDQLNVQVQGGWSACSLANPVFFEPMSTITRVPVAAWPEGVKLTRRELEPLAALESGTLAESV